MKTKLLFLILLLSYNLANSQAWSELYPKDKTEKVLNFKDYQKVFKNKWKDKNIQGGYYIENGNKKKAYGWKQFKRWEHYWEKRVNQNTGEFPTSKTYEIAKHQYNNSIKIKDRKIINRDGKEITSSTGNWISLGPNSSSGGYQGVGRINQIAFHPTKNNTFWVTTPGGGVWKTTNGGSTWTVLTDELENLTTSAIAIPSDYATSKTIYIGSGEKDSWRHDNGIGVLKSTDGGLTWKKTGLTFDVKDGIVVNKILIHPTINSLLYAATSKGIYKSNNSGKTWSEIYSKKYIVDMEFKPGNPSIIYASNKHWGEIYKLNSSGTNIEKIYDEYSFDGRRVELAVSPQKPNELYALVANSDGGLYEIAKSTNSGLSFSTLYKPASPATKSKPNILSNKKDGDGDGGQGWYDLSLIVDPVNPKVMYCGGVSTWKTTDGGKNWKLNTFWTNYYCNSCEIVHADKHSFAYNNNTLYECNDGGLYKTTNGINWTSISNGIVNSQMYKLGVTKSNSKETITGLQDNGTKSYSNGYWSYASGGDGMECIIDYKNDDTQYATIQNGEKIYRTKNHWWSKEDVHPSGAEGDWVIPFIIDPIKHNTLYAGYQHIYKSINNGDSWDIIYDLDSDEKFRCLAISESNTKVLYASEPKRIWKTTNGGTSWKNITSGLPNEFITSIAIKSDDPNTVWITFGGFDKHIVYQTKNGGTSWKNISTGLPYIPANSIIQNKQNSTETELYVGTDFGVYVKLGTSNWKLFNTGLPKVIVEELEIYYANNLGLSKLRAATYGRGLWESDLLSISATPIADFNADKTSIKKGKQIVFTDLSLNIPTSWSWEFEGGSPSVSTLQNPTIQYNNPGIYNVKLTSTNSFGSNSIIKEGFISVSCGNLAYSSSNVQTLAGTYQDLNSDGNIITTDNFNDDNSEPIDIGFTFEFNCLNFTKFVLNTNGFIKLGSTIPTEDKIFFSSASGNIDGLFDTAENNLLSPFNHDLKGGANPEYRVFTSGTSPNRVCTIQFEGLTENTYSPQYDDIEFQIKLYEKSNIIEFIYGDWTASQNFSTYKSAACGIKGSGTDNGQIIVVSKDSRNDWNNLNFSNSNYSSLISTFNFGNPPNRPKPDIGRTIRFIPNLDNDLSVNQIHSFGVNSIFYGNPQKVHAFISNNGKNNISNALVTLEISQANKYSDTLILPIINVGDTLMVTFSNINLTNIGENKIKITVEDDDFNGNNFKELKQRTTNNFINYCDNGPPLYGWGYKAGYEGIFSTRYHIFGTTEIKAVDIFIYNYSKNIGQEVFAVLLNSSGDIIASSDHLNIKNSDLGKWISFEINDSPVFINEDLFAGLAVTKTNSASAYYALGIQKEVPSRVNTYANSALLGGQLLLRDDDFGYRYMIGIETKSQDAASGEAIAINDSICKGENTALNLSNYKGNIQWQQSINGNSNWINAIGGNGSKTKSYTTPNLNADRYYRAKVSLGNSIKYSNIIHITINPEYSLSEEVVVCKGDSYTFPDNSTETNIQSDLNHTSDLSTTLGCDSIIVTNVKIHELDLSIYVNDSTLTSNASSVNYQWINCDNNTEIEDETNNSFTPYYSGSYGIIISDNICLDTSECISIIGTNTYDLESSIIEIYPNPTNDILIIDFNQIPPFSSNISIIDISGKEIVNHNKASHKKLYKINVSDINTGLYIVRIKWDTKVIYKKLIIER